MKRFSKSLAILLVFALILTGCAQKAAETVETKAAETVETKAAETVETKATETVETKATENDSVFKPIDGTPVTIKIFATKNVDVAPFDQLVAFKAYSDQVGVKVEWENPTAQDNGERFNLIISSGDLPDMFWLITAAQYNTLYALNALAPLSALIEEGAPNLKARMAEYPNDNKYIIDASTDEIYMLPFYDELTTNNPMAVREDWLTNLGLKEPATTDEWESVWKAFKEQDANGNGDPNDEIPFSTNSLDNLLSLVAGWGMLNEFYVDVAGDGKIHFANIEPKFEDFLTWMNRMYKAGYIDQEIGSTTSTIFRGKVAENIIGSFRGTLNGNFNSFNTTVAPNIPGFSYIGTVPLIGPEGDQLHPGCSSFVNNNMIGGVVSKSSKNAQICVSYCDPFYDKAKGTFLVTHGEEGVSYNLVDGEPIFTDFILKNPDGLSPMQALCSVCWIGNGPAFSLSDTSFQMWDSRTADAYKKIVAFYDVSIPYFVQALPFSSKEDEEVRSTMADITTYVDEAMLNFITGKKPMSEYSEYVTQVNNMKMQRVLELYNTAYSRWK